MGACLVTCDVSLNLCKLTFLFSFSSRLVTYAANFRYHFLCGQIIKRAQATVDISKMSFLTSVRIARHVLNQIPETVKI